MNKRPAVVRRGLCFLAFAGFGVLHAQAAAAQASGPAGGNTGDAVAPPPAPLGAEQPPLETAPPSPPVPQSPPEEVDATPADVASDPRFGQRTIGASANVGTYSGFTLGLRAGVRRFGAEASFGLLPILVMYSSPNGDPNLKLLNGYQINAGLYTIFAQIRRFGVGMHLGYKYNAVLKHGVAGGAYMTFDLTRTLLLHATVGISVYPNGEDEVVRRLPDPCEGYSNCSGSYKFSLTPAVQSGISVGVLFFPG
jgi:hypothetical protein